MAEVKASYTLRPNKKQVAGATALPYDVCTREETKATVWGRPFSFLNIDRSETQFPESYGTCMQEVYRKARDMLREQAAVGVHVRGEQPVYYFYELTVESGVLTSLLQGHNQTGMVACSLVDSYLNQVAREHEDMREERERDRTRHVNTVNTQTDPISLAYRDTETLKTHEKRTKQ